MGHGSDVELADSPEVLARLHAGLPIVEKMARRFAAVLGANLEFDDLVGYGRVGLLAAARQFEETRGPPFEAYATFMIRNAIFDAVRGLALSRRTYERLRVIEAATRISEGLSERTFYGAPAPRMAQKQAEAQAAMATAMAIGMLAAVARQEGEHVGIERLVPEQELSNAQRRALIDRLITELPVEEGELIRRHYLEDERFDDVAKDLKISKSWASRLHTRAIGRLERGMRREC